MSAIPGFPPLTVAARLTIARELIHRALETSSRLNPAWGPPPAPITSTLEGFAQYNREMNGHALSVRLQSASILLAGAFEQLHAAEQAVPNECRQVPAPLVKGGVR